MWLLKIFIKIILSRLPIEQKIWRKIGIFRNGGMNQVDYSKRIFFGHLGDLKSFKNVNEPVILEIGPGDGIATAIYSRVYNSPKVYLIDVEEYADTNISRYKDIILSLKDEKNFKNINLSSLNTISDLLKEFNTSYLTKGIESLKKIENFSVDYIFSHSVMEHIRLSSLDEMIEEMNRVLKVGGLVSHNINYKDHLSDSLNNLRFSRRIWESNFFANSGFYTNRVPAVEMHKKFVNSGFEIIYQNFGSWPTLPLKRKYIHKEFSKYNDKELNNCTSNFIAKKISS